jgi:hypothetical protein
MSDTTIPVQTIVAPFKDLKPGFYGYSRPDWSQVHRVEVYVSEGYRDGETLVRFKEGYFGTPLNDLPHDAYFVLPSDSDMPL